MKKILFGFIISAFAISSCNDDYFNPDVDDNHMDKIGYAINIANESDEFQSRGNITKTNKHITVEKLDATIGGKTLYLHTDVSNTIPESASVATNDKTLSRGSISKSVDEINVSAVVINGCNGAKGWPASGESQMYMNNERVSEEYNWITGRYWPQEQDSIRFYAYAPIDALASTSVDGADGLPGINNEEPSFYYKVNDDIEKQQDLLVAVAQYKGNYCKPAQINMCHALTAVEIHLSKDVNDFKLKNLTISGIENEGIYDYGFTPILGNNEESARESGSWQLHDTDSQLAQYTLYSNDDGMELSGSQVNMSENANGDTTLLLMMIPQVLTDEATIIVEGVDGIMNKDVKLTAKIGGNGKAWHKGEHVVYTLTFSSTKIDYYIDVVANNSQNIPYYGIKDQEYTVKSYKVISRSGLDPLTIAVPWEVVAIENGNEVELPAGLIMTGLSGNGVSDASLAENGTYCLLANLRESESSQSNMNILAGTSSLSASLGTADVPYDLSTKQDYSTNKYPQNTANSYMVLAPGYYTFPLVYGNAITNGATNSSAYTGYSGSYNQELAETDYTGNLTGGTIAVPCKGLGNFVDHANNAISGPWIVNVNNRGGRYVPATAEIVWQDEPCLVTELKLNAEKDYIQFRVNAETICDGNAIIAVKDSDGTIMWSWHIWVQDGIAYHNNSTVEGDYNYARNYINSTTKEFGHVGMTSRRITSSSWVDGSWGSSNSTSTYTGQKFSMMYIFLGHCDGEAKIYNPRTIKVRFKQVEDPNVEFKGTLHSTDLTFTQEQGSVTTVTNIPYYQYGRKDPMLPTGQKNADKIYYDNDWQPHMAIVKAGKQATIAEAIKAPGTFFAQQSRSIENKLRNYNWCSEGTYMNLWNSNSWSVPSFAYHSNFDNGNRYKFHAWFNNLIESGMTKTVYDPCPPGYELPRYDAFTGASYHGMNLYPLWYDGKYDMKLFAFGRNSNTYPGIETKAGHHIYGNVWINPDGTPYQIQSVNFNSISIFATPMNTVGDRGDPTISWGGESLPVIYFGHRNQNGNVDKYGVYASALTSAPVCTQNMNNTNAVMEDNAQYMLTRFCTIKSADAIHNTGTLIPYSLRVFSGSDFDLAFGIIPAVSGSNPYSATTSVNNGGIEWTEGNKSDQTVDF